MMYLLADLGLKVHPPQQVVEARVVAEGVAIPLLIDLRTTFDNQLTCVFH